MYYYSKYLSIKYMLQVVTTNISQKVKIQSLSIPTP